MRERSHLHILSNSIFQVIPVISVLFGIGLSVWQLHDGGVTAAPAFIYFIMALFPIFDLFSGILSYFSFFLVQIFLGHPKSIREVLAVASLSIAIVGPAFAYTALNALIGNYRTANDDSKRLNGASASSFFAGAVAAITFYVGLILGFSLHITVVGGSRISVFLPLILVVIVVVKNLYLEERLIQKLDWLEDRVHIEEKSIRIGRVISPISAFIIFLFFSSTLYIWFENWISASVISLILTIPYIFMFLNISGAPFAFLNKIRRNWFLEPILVLICTLGILFALEKLPLNVLQRSHFFIFLTLIPIIAHSLFSALWDGVDREFHNFSPSHNEGLAQ
jgi:hypothetical protein